MNMTHNFSTHIVDKRDNAQHLTISSNVSIQANALSDASIRVVPYVLMLSANNLSYARAGTMLSFWDAYPVSKSIPSPYNDSIKYGIVPAWGFARVVDSSIEEISKDAILWGFWPTSSAYVDLELTTSDVPGHWIEVSKHRSRLMSLYNRYTLMEGSQPTLENLAVEALFRLHCACGHVLNQYIFTFNPTQAAPVHPLGAGGSWDSNMADLSNAIVVTLAASSKTAQMFNWHLIHARPKSQMPLALLLVTSSATSALESIGPDDQVDIRTASYTEIAKSDILDWISHKSPKRLVMLDCGSRGKSLNEFVEAMDDHPSLQCIEKTIVAVGNEAKVYSQDELQDQVQINKLLGKVQLNTSDARDRVIEAEGGKKYFEGETRDWELWLSSHPKVASKIEWKHGIEGVNGIEGSWQKLCDGTVQPGSGLIFKII